MASPFSLSCTHIHTEKQINFCFSTMIINTRVMQTSKWQALVSVLSTEYICNSKTRLNTKKINDWMKGSKGLSKHERHEKRGSIINYK